MDPVGEGSKLINIHLTICNNRKSTVEAFGVCYVVFQLCMGAVGMHFILKSITVMCNVNAAICFTQTDFLVMDNLYFCLNTVAVECLNTLPAYIRDSSDLIEKCSNIKDLSDDTLLITMDITSLYTNIPHNGGLEALSFYLQDDSDSSTPPNQLILDLTEFIMKYNYFRFENDFYLQISGTSMGTICAPNYANLFVGFFEKKFVFNDGQIGRAHV